jgi:putative flippase GtrA
VNILAGFSPRPSDGHFIFSMNINPVALIIKLMNKQTVRQFIIFSMMGAIGTGGHYLVLVLLVELFNQSASISTTAGFIVGAFINYILNYHITFKSIKPHREALVKFLLIAAIGAIINTMIMYFGTNILHYHYFLIQIIATLLVLIWNFTVNKIWVFSTST